MKPSARALVAATLVASLSSSGCATFIRRHANGDGSVGVNVVTSTPPESTAIAIAGAKMEPRLVYDGRQNGSPFFVYRCIPPHRADELTVILTTPQGTSERTVTKQSESLLAWFLISGLWFIPDLFTHAYTFYDDARFE
jgi:hypothetical protein